MLTSLTRSTGAFKLSHVYSFSQFSWGYQVPRGRNSQKPSKKNNIIGLLDVLKIRGFRQSGDYLYRNFLCFSKHRLSSRYKDIRDDRTPVLNSNSLLG